MGVLGQLSCTNNILLMSACYVMSGVAMWAAVILPDLSGCFICAIVFGVAYTGCNTPLLEVIIWKPY